MHQLFRSYVPLTDEKKLLRLSPETRLKCKRANAERKWHCWNWPKTSFLNIFTFTYHSDAFLTSLVHSLMKLFRGGADNMKFRKQEQVKGAVSLDLWSIYVRPLVNHPSRISHY